MSPSSHPLQAPARALLLVIAALLGSAQAGSQAAPNSAASVGADLQMAQDAEPFREVAEAFVARAMAGDMGATQALLSPAMVERSGEANVRRALEAQILPFFQRGLGLGNSRTITRSSDASGRQGYAFYLWLKQRDGSEARPFTVYVLAEGGRAMVANIVPDRLVAGRHR